MEHTLDEGDFPLDIHPSGLYVLHPVFVALSEGIGGIVDAFHLAVKRLLHGGKAVLQQTDLIFAIRKWHHLVVMAVGNLLRHAQQTVNGTDNALDSTIAEPEAQHQSYEDEGYDDVRQMLVAGQHLVFETNHSQTPIGAFYWGKRHMTLFAIDVDMHRSLFASRHLVG